MTISVLGVIMILVTFLVLGYLGFQAISSTINTNVGSGTSYDKIAVLKSDYSNLQMKYNSTKVTVDKANDKNLTAQYDNAEIQLIQAQTDISEAESAVTSNKSPAIIQNRIDVAQQQLQTARDSLSNLQSKIGTS
jgi:hypothetical protein